MGSEARQRDLWLICKTSEALPKAPAFQEILPPNFQEFCTLHMLMPKESKLPPCLPKIIRNRICGSLCMALFVGSYGKIPEILMVSTTQIFLPACSFPTRHSVSLCEIFALNQNQPRFPRMHPVNDLLQTVLPSQEAKMLFNIP